MSSIVIHPTEEQEKIVKAFLEALDIPFATDEEEQLPPHVLVGIKKGEEDYEAGRHTSFDEFKKNFTCLNEVQFSFY